MRFHRITPEYPAGDAIPMSDLPWAEPRPAKFAEAGRDLTAQEIGALDNQEYVRLAREALDQAVSLSADELPAERRRQFPDPRRAKRRNTDQPKDSAVLSCSGVGNARHEVVLSTPLRPWTYGNGEPAVLAFGEWPATQERFSEPRRERWRFKCPACTVDYSRRETDLAWIILRAITAGITDLSISAVLASHQQRQ